MDQALSNDVQASITTLRLPTYQEIPDVGLYLEQTAKYISDALSPILDTPVTGSMISNYVKKGMIAKPIRKQYSREQIAHLIFIAIMKSVVSMDDVSLMFAIQQETYESSIAYTYFRTELLDMLEHVFTQNDEINSLSPDSAQAKVMLRNAIVTVSHKIYLDKLFAVLRLQDMHA